MKKTFRLAAVLVTLAALVMASCQNAAGGSGGGGGGVTPTPTPPEPETKTVEGDAIKLVGSYKLNEITRLVLNSDGTGSISYGSSSASARSILLNDVTFTWEIDGLTLADMVDGTAAANNAEDKAHDVNIPYVKLTLPEGATVKVNGGTVWYYKRDTSTGATVPTKEKKKIDGLQLSLLNGADIPVPVDLGTETEPFIWGKTASGVTGLALVDSSDAFDEDRKVTSDRGIKVELDVEGVVLPEGGLASLTSPIDPVAPQVRDLVGTWTVALSESKVSYIDSSTKDKVELEGESATDIFKQIPAITEDDANAIYMITGVNVTNGGSTADVDVIIYDPKIDWEFDENKKGENAYEGGLNYFVESEDNDIIQVSNMKKLMNSENDTENEGFATGVIADCKLEVKNDGSVILTKVISQDVDDPTDIDPTKVTTVLTLTPNVPFASAVEKQYDQKTGPTPGPAEGENVTAAILYQKGVVTE